MLNLRFLRSSTRAVAGAALACALGCSAQDPSRNATDGAAGPAEPPPLGPAVENVGDLAKTPAPASGRRLTNQEYAYTILDAFGVDVASQAAMLPMEADVEGFRNQVSGLVPSENRTEIYASIAQHVASSVDLEQLLSRHAACRDHESTCYSAFVQNLGLLLFRRPLSSEQELRFMPLFDVVREHADEFGVGARLVLQAMLQSPEFLYRLEPLGAGGSARVVDAYELASRLSFLIWGAAPSAELLATAAQGGLSDQPGVAAAVAGLISHPNARRAFREYLEDWIELSKVERAQRDPAQFPGFTGQLAADMKEETLRFFEELVWQQNGDFLNYLTAEQTFATPELAGIYGLQPLAPGLNAYDLSGLPERSGLLTQASVLTGRALTNDAAIDRGVFILRDILCVTIPEPPAGVPALPEAQEGARERDRLAVHREAPACAGCHSMIDPLGFGLEVFDAIGRYRTSDDLGLPLSGSGTLVLPSGEAPYQNVAEFTALLRQSPEAQQCVAQKALQHGLGRPLSSDLDTKLLDAQNAQFAARGNSFQSAHRQHCRERSAAHRGAQPRSPRA